MHCRLGPQGCIFAVANGPMPSFGSRLLRTCGADPPGCLRCPWAASAGWPPPLMSSELGCAQFSPFTSLRGPPDCRSPAPSRRATVAREHCCRKGGLGLAAARTRCAEKRRARGLARSASCELTHRGCLSAESEANEASSAMGPRERASQGSRRNAPTAEHKRRSQAQPAFALGPSQQAKNIERTDERTTVRKGPKSAITPRALAASHAAPPAPAKHPPSSASAAAQSVHSRLRALRPAPGFPARAARGGG